MEMPCEREALKLHTREVRSPTDSEDRGPTRRIPVELLEPAVEVS